MSSAEAIARSFRARIGEGAIAEPETYYAVQRDCMSLLATASSSAAKTALFCAAALAERLARETEDEAIAADAEGEWHAYTDALERVLRISESESSAQELLWALANSIATIIPPRGRP